MSAVPLLACDWNGTLVDDAPRAWRATAAVLARRSLPPIDLRGFLAAFRLPLAAFFADLGVAADDRAAAEREWNRELADGPPPTPMHGLGAMLDGLDALGVAVGVVSAAARAAVEQDVERLGVADRLAFVVGGAAPKRVELSRLVATTRGTVAYLGDTEHDVEEALAAGARAIGFGGGYRPLSALAAAGAELLAGRLEEVPGIVAALRAT